MKRRTAKYFARKRRPKETETILRKIAFAMKTIREMPLPNYPAGATPGKGGVAIAGERGEEMVLNNDEWTLPLLSAERYNITKLK